MDSRMNIGLAAGLAVLVAALLVGGRLGFAWAGGPGYEAPQAATVRTLDGTATASALGRARPLSSGDAVRRGETVQTGDGSYLELSFANGSRLALDADTDAALETLSYAEVAVRMTHGRLVAEDASRRQFTIRTNESESAVLAGDIAVIDQADRAVVHVVPFGGLPVGIIVHKQDGFVASQPQQVHEIAPYEVTAAGEDATVKAAAAFFARFGVR